MSLTVNPCKYTDVTAADASDPTLSMEIPLEQKALHLMDKPLLEEAGQKGVQKEPVCMMRSDTMSIGSVSSVGGASEGMDTEDSEKDARDGFSSSGRSSFSSVDGQQKRLFLDNENRGYAPPGDLTSPVIENKLSDDLDGYYVMRTRLMSQSAVILENGAAFGNDRSPGLCDNQDSNKDTRNTNEGQTDESDQDAEVQGMCTRDKNEYFMLKDHHTGTEGMQLSPDKLSDNQDREDNFSSLSRVGGGFCDVIIKTESMSDEESQGLLTKMPDDEDSSASESIAEVEKFGLEAKLARVSKRRIYSRAKELSKAADSSSESDSDSESEEEEEEEKYAILDDMHEAKVLVNAAQPDSEKLIKREALKMACTDDLLSDYVSSEDSSASSSDSSSAESSDSDDSTDLDLSSVEESDGEEEQRPSKPRQNSRPSRDGLNQGLPKVEYLDIRLPDSVQLKKVGSVSSIIGSLVIVQADHGTPALDAETVLFKPDRTVIGQVFELFGPVVSPFYSVRFNNPADIEERCLQLMTEVWFAPQNIDVTQYVFTEQLKKMRGSDASWKNDEEPPDDFVEFSDDELESTVRNKKKDKRRKVAQRRKEFGQDNWNQRQEPGHFHGIERQNFPRTHPPLQRQPPIRPPPQFAHRRGPPPPHNHHRPPHHPSYGHFPPRHNQTEINSYQKMARPTSFRHPHNSSSRQFGPREQAQGPPRPPGLPPGLPLGNAGFRPPMFLNPQVTSLPPPPLQQAVSTSQPVQQQPQEHNYNAGFSARNTENAYSWQRKAKNESIPLIHGTFSFRETGILPPWQLRPPPLPPPAWQQPPPPLNGYAGPTLGTQPPPAPSGYAGSTPGTQPVISPATLQPTNQTAPHVVGQTAAYVPPPPPSPLHTPTPHIAAAYATPPPPPPPPSTMTAPAATFAPPPPPPPLMQQPVSTPDQITAPVVVSQAQHGAIQGAWPPPLMQQPVSAPDHVSLSVVDSQARHAAMQGSWLPSPVISQMPLSFPPPPIPPPSFHPRMMHSFREAQNSTGRKASSRPADQ